jgi:hypothetical protein
VTVADDPNKLEEYLATVLAGSLVGQLAAERGLQYSDLAPGSTTLRSLANELANLGFDPAILASHSLNSLVALFAQPSNADLITGQFTALLWSILGDPKNGGRPPEIYRRAGVAMHLALLGILDPSIVERRTRS